MNYLWFNRTLSQSVVEPRLHHQLLPMYIRMDQKYSMSLGIQEGLQRLGHEVKNKRGYAVVQLRPEILMGNFSAKQTLERILGPQDFKAYDDL